MAATVLSVVALVGATSARADNVITDCGQSCEVDCDDPPGNCRKASGGKCILESDITCDSSESAITLNSGLNLDLQGYDITCTETLPSTCNYAAVRVNDDGGSQITSDGSGDDGESEISGPFATGVSCALKTNSVAENLTIFDALFGIVDCKTVRNNVIGASSQIAWGGNWGIASNAAISSSDSFVDNYISGRIIPIAAANNSTVQIQRNVIDTDGAVQAAGLGTSSTGFSGLAKFNIFFGEGYDGSSSIFNVSGTDTGTYQGNFCDVDHPGCAACIAAERCEPYTSPFAGN